MFRAIKQFVEYVIRYFTHYTVIQISKESDIIVPNKWYSISYYFKHEESHTICIDDIRVLRLKKLKRKRGYNG